MHEEQCSASLEKICTKQEKSVAGQRKIRSRLREDHELAYRPRAGRLAGAGHALNSAQMVSDRQRGKMIISSSRYIGDREKERGRNQNGTTQRRADPA